MSRVTASHLKGNWGESLIAHDLRSEGCLVRTADAGTDVGVDLYCETTTDSEDTSGHKIQVPFLHFWIQVKTGNQVQVSKERDSAHVRVSAEHERYWRRQPVPVFIAMIPESDPGLRIERYFVASVLRRVYWEHLEDAERTKTVRINSHFVVDRFKSQGSTSLPSFIERLSRESPLSVLRYGVAVPQSRVREEYVRYYPTVPMSGTVPRAICQQIRCTAAQAIFSAWEANSWSACLLELERLHAILTPFRDDPHWENHFALGLVDHMRGRFSAALTHYRRAKSSIEGDTNLKEGSKLRRVHGAQVETCLRAARHKRTLPRYDNFVPD